MYNSITIKEFLLAIKNGMKVLYLDCETSPSKFWGFNTGKSYISIANLVAGSDTKIICTQFKFEGQKKAKYAEWDRIGKHEFNDKSLLEETSRLINEADIIVGQNIDSFDMKILNNRLAMNKLPPIDNDNTIDILKLSKKSFRTLSHALTFRSKKYGKGGKIKMDMQDWIDVVEGKVSVSKKIGPYGCKDIEDTQAILHREFNYYKKLPASINKIIKSYLPITKASKPIVSCLRCNGNMIVKGYKLKAGGQKMTQRQCNNCGKYKTGVI